MTLPPPLSDAPAATARVVLRPKKARPFYSRHPWVLDTAIARVEGDPADGDVVELVNDQGQFIATGLFNAQSRIRVRLYSWQPGEPLDDGFWLGRLAAALRLREALGYTAADGAARLVFSEGDGLGGLVVDRFGEHLVVQVNAAAIAARLPRLLNLLEELVRPRGIVVRTDRQTAKLEGPLLAELASRQGDLGRGAPADGPVFVAEHGLRYGVDLAGGQKTGFFLDQRENRRAAAAYFRGRSVLDVCCYSGGFALAAAALGGAREVLGLDSSEAAITLARANAELNGLANVRFETADCFDRLRTLAAEGRRFGGIVLDPPKFARNRQALADALRAYERINRLAVQALEPDGILVTCSCTGGVGREELLDVLAEVARQTRREIQVLEQRGAAPDHPFSATCLEGEYLKCFICRVV